MTMFGFLSDGQADMYVFILPDLSEDPLVVMVFALLFSMLRRRRRGRSTWSCVDGMC
jgi:hypothetical protein